jgi:hypothetical protein
MGKYFGGLVSLAGVGKVNSLIVDYFKQGNEEFEKMKTENSYLKKQVDSMSSKLSNYDR